MIDMTPDERLEEQLKESNKDMKVFIIVLCIVSFFYYLLGSFFYPLIITIVIMEYKDYQSKKRINDD